MRKIRLILTILVLQCLFLFPLAAGDSSTIENHSNFSFSQNGFEQSSPAPIDRPDASGSSLQPSINALRPMTDHEKFNYYLRSTYGLRSIGFNLARAGMGQVRNSTPEWGQTLESYGIRFASAFGNRIVKQSINLGLKTMFHEDLRYRRMGGSGVWRRGFYAASRVFVAHKDSGGTRPNYTWLASSLGGSVLSRQWHPERYRTWGDSMASFGISLGFDAARAAFCEFWPDVKKQLHF